MLRPSPRKWKRAIRARVRCARKDACEGLGEFFFSGEERLRSARVA
jgi:hypothetical protein